MSGSNTTFDTAVAQETTDADLVRAVYIRAGQPKTNPEIDALISTVMAQVDFNVNDTSEADVTRLLGKLGLTDASLPPPDAPVPLTRTLPNDSFPAYAAPGSVDITGKTAVELEAMLNSGAITSREIVLQYMYRIQQYDHAGPALRAVAQINPDVLAIADEMDAERAAAKASGRTLPPLFGVPALVKLNIDTADGLFTTAGDDALIGSKPSADATLIAGMRDQGLIIFGKANMGQWAGIVSNNDSSTGGQSIDPRDPTTVVGGSSSGPAISAAMDFAPITVGTQTSDSIIYPASQQGVYALKTTEGLVSTTGVAPYSHYIDSAGPMANSVEDLALALNGMVKQDQTDTRAAGFVRPADYSAGLTGDLSGMKVGVFTDTYDPTYHAAVEGMLASAGATVVQVHRNDVSNAIQTALSTLSPADLQTFMSLAPQSGVTDFVDLLNGAGGSAISTFIFGDIYTSITSYLATRVSSSSDYRSAYIRLLGDKFSALHGDTSAYAKTLADLAAFARANPALDSGDQQFRSFGSSVQADSAGYQNFIRIVTSIVAGMRSALGIDAGIGFIGPDDGFNDGLSGGAAYGFTIDQLSASPQLTVPVEIGGKVSNILIDANAYSEQTLLKIGAAFEKQLNTDPYKQYKVVPPNPPVTGYANQPVDNGPLLPLVINNLDDNNATSPAHLLSTVMAPLTLNTTDTSKVPLFNGIISGDGGLIKEGAGVQTLTGTSDFTGDVQVWNGGLLIDRTAALGAIANTITLEGGSSLGATGSFVLGRALVLKNGGAVYVDTANVLIEDKVVSGNGGLRKTGSGQLVLSGANAYTGGTAIVGGVLTVASDQNLGQDYGEITFGDGATLAVMGSFTTHRQMHLNGANGIFVGAQATLTEDNVIDGTGQLVLTGPGTLVLTNSSNSYRGGTALLRGTLEITTMTAAGASGISFGTGAQTLRLDANGLLTNVISGFSSEDTIDLAALAYSAQVTEVYDAGVKHLVVSDGTNSVTLSFADLASTFAGGVDFAVTSDGNGGSLVRATPRTNVSIGTVAGDGFIDRSDARSRKGLHLGGTISGLSAASSLLIAVVDGPSPRIYRAKIASGGVWSVVISRHDLMQLPNGTAKISAFILDSSGGVTLAASQVVTVDLTPPAAPSPPVMTTLSDSGRSSTDSLTRVATPTLTGTAEAGAAITLYDGTRVVGFGRADASGVYAVTASALRDGLHRMVVRATDAAGNVSSPSRAHAIRIDTKAPRAPAAPKLAATSDSGLSAGDGITRATTLTFTGVTEAGATVTLSGDGQTVGAGVANRRGRYRIVTTTLAPGAHSFTVTATDAAGNTSAASAPRTVVIDTTAPAAPDAPTLAAASDSGLPADGLTNVRRPFITGTAEAGARVTLYGGSVVLGSAIAGRDGAYTIRSARLSQGAHALTVTATDAAGNVSAPSAASLVFIDFSAPARPGAPVLAAGSDSGGSASDRVTNVTTPTMTGITEANALVRLYDRGRFVGSALADAAGRYAVTAAPLSDGSHNLRVTAVDAAGNVSTFSRRTTIIIDTKAPGVAITSAGGTAAGPNQVISGRAEAGSTITLMDNGNQVGSAIVVGRRGTWSEAITLSAGSNSVVATATDAAGNQGTSNAATFQFGTTPPAASASLANLVQAMAVVTPTRAATGLSTSPPLVTPDHTLAVSH